MQKEKIESSNSKTMRYTLWAIAAISTFICLTNIPNRGNVADVQNQIKETQLKTVAIKKNVKENSPLNKKNKFDLAQGETDASNLIKKNVALVFGGMHTEQDYKSHKTELTKFFGKKFMKTYAVYNPSYPNDKCNFTKIYFGQVTDIYHAPVTVYIEYEGQKTPYSIAFNFDYDLKNQKVNNFRQESYLSSAVLQNRGSNL